jgi:hypothetical protein
MFRVFALAALAAVAMPAAAEDTVVLENPAWRLSIDAETLAIVAKPVGQATVQVSTGAATHVVSDVVADTSQARWQWDGGTYSIALTLDGNDLVGSITAAAPGTFAFLSQPASGRGLILPFAEGHYAPAGNPTWTRWLARLGDINTTQDLSLPFWGTDYGTFTLSWLLTNPYNNTLSFSPGKGGAGISVRHAFTRLDPGAPLTFMLHLDGPDLLAGARRYRQYLVESGAFEPLSEKLARTVSAGKLIGATHVYLWGSGLLSAADVADWPAFLRTLRGDDPLAARLREHMEDEAQQMLSSLSDRPEAWQGDAIIAAVDAALDGIARTTWMADPTDAAVLTGAYADLRARIAAMFGSALHAEQSRWGRGEATGTIEAIRESGLKRLWIGLGEGWEGGLWHPEAIKAAVDAGYLIAPYDSYQDAMKPGLRTDWATSHLGQAAHDGCAVIQPDGQPHAGFKGEGRYTTPECVRPILEARIRAIQAAAGFNSWFLDSYAAGMLFDSYRKGAEMTQAQHAAGNAESLRLVNDALGLPTGSEDGNATTAGGLLFGHGMQTPFIGWGDPEMHEDQHSPHYVGGWWPSGEPAVFFKRVPLPERYRTIHFDPAHRLPLYQAVFHDSIITTHHWSFDSLKFEDVDKERELTRLLYNVPGLYHLSAGSLETRLPLIKRQDSFFRPLHERLWDVALTGFQWRSDDRLVQETTFADGTRLIANFSDRLRQVDEIELPALSVTAVVPDEEKASYRVE